MACGDQGLGAEERKKTFLEPVEAGTQPAGLTAEGNIFVPRGSKRKTSCVWKKKPSLLWKTLGSAFQSHCLRFKPLRLLKKPRWEAGDTQEPPLEPGVVQLVLGAPRSEGFLVPLLLPRSSQPHQSENLTLPLCTVNCFLLPHVVFTDNHLLLELCAEVVILTVQP